MRRELPVDGEPLQAASGVTGVSYADTPRRRRLVVFTADLGYSVRQGIVDVDRSFPGLSWLIVLHVPHRSLGQLFRSQWRNLLRNGWRWIPYQMLELWRRARARGSPADGTAGLPGGEYALSALASCANMRIVRLDLYAAATHALVREFAPELGLSLAAPLLPHALFSTPSLGTLNLHKGQVPEYRGMPPAFWELWNGAASVGCTVHWVEERLDTGAVVQRAQQQRSRFSTLRGLQLQLDELGVALMRTAVGDVLRGVAPAEPQGPNGRTFRKPTLAQQAELARRLKQTEPPQAPWSMRVLRETRSLAGITAGRAGVFRALTPRITVVLYHRVSDDVRDNLTVGIEQFGRHMALLRRHCRVLPIEEVLACDKVPASGTPLVAVTFDDGYLDNYLNAAPILRRYGIPAAFFVATGIVGTDKRFPHDLRRGNPPIAVMSWDQLRSMRDWGFTIGSHSEEHIDCAAEPEATVQSDLARSRARLHDELGLREILFAYPYGGRHNMTPQRLDLVRQAGYAGCLAAYGGSNVGRVDRYNVLRRGIHWQFSDRAFLFECLGLT